jgi:hypothetical protein
MARVHGKDARAYLGARDVSGDLNSIDITANVDTHDATTFGAEYLSYDPGLGSWEASVDGFYQTNSGGSVTSIERQFEAMLGVTTTGTTVLSVYDGDADGVGDAGILCSDAILTKHGQLISVADLVKISGTLAGNGRAGLNGRLLHVLAADASSTNGSSYDNSASSSSGGRANLHITAASGTGGTIKIQHSSDNSTWVDLITFTAATAATSETKTVTGTVNRYLRVASTINSSSSLTYVTGFERF